jgi:hypothetical protein
LIDGKGESAVFEEGSFDEEPAWLCAHFSLVRMLETILALLESQSGREKAADRANRRAAKVRTILELLTS